MALTLLGTRTFKVRGTHPTLANPSHRIVFHYTPKHSSSRYQIEIWFSILDCSVIRRGHFLSTENLKSKINAFIKVF